MTKKPDEPIFPDSVNEPMDKRLPLERELEKRDPEVDTEAEKRRLLQEEMESIRHQIDPEYAAKNRAAFLRSVPVSRGYSPANRVAINRPKGDPNVYRFNSEAVRERIGMEGWVPVTDMEEAKKICPSAYLRKGTDGKIYSGDSFLCSQPEENVEMRNAAILQKSERSLRAAETGSVSLGTESFADMHARTKTAEDPIGIRMSGRLSEDSPS